MCLVSCSRRIELFGELLNIFLNLKFVYGTLFRIIKNSASNYHNMRQLEESDSGSKPLAATLMQEFQNLKDKFKNEDDSYEKGEHLKRLFQFP